MQISESQIKISRSARYFCNMPELTPQRLVFVLHGYAQTARDFLEEFSFLEDGSTLLVAPEGLSRFYSRNKVVASWMTKEMRIAEIYDYVTYLDTVEEDIRQRFGLRMATGSVLGFSQGVHTAVRWYTNSRFAHGELILCSSDFPSDADLETLKARLRYNSLVYIQGMKDDVSAPDSFDKGKFILEAGGVPYHEITFNGKHEIDRDSVTTALKK